MKNYIKHIVEDFNFDAVKEPDFLETVHNNIFKKVLTFKPLTNHENLLFTMNCLNCYVYKYVLEDPKELRQFLWNSENGDARIRFQKGLAEVGDLNWIDVSYITNMNKMFFNIQKFYMIDRWDVSNVVDMSEMFEYSMMEYNISKWDVSNVKNMHSMFANTQCNWDICNWDVSNCKDFAYMFYNSLFDRDISNWNITDDACTDSMFYECIINDNYKPEKLQPKFKKIMGKFFFQK